MDTVIMERKIDFKKALKVISKMESDYRIKVASGQLIIYLLCDIHNETNPEMADLTIIPFSRFKVFHSTGYNVLLNAFIALPGSDERMRLEDYLSYEGIFDEYLPDFDLAQQKEAILRTGVGSAHHKCCN